jgi:hypothetical protein
MQIGLTFARQTFVTPCGQEGRRAEYCVISHLLEAAQPLFQDATNPTNDQ